jgi:hypothetical protein
MSENADCWKGCEHGGSNGVDGDVLSAIVKGVQYFRHACIVLMESSCEWNAIDASTGVGRSELHEGMESNSRRDFYDDESPNSRSLALARSQKSTNTYQHRY